MKREFSAGGIIFRKFKIPNLPNDPLRREARKAGFEFQIKWLVVQHSQHKGWVFPKGLIGDTKKGEKKEETAVREVREEGGIDAKIIKKLPRPVKYWYVLNAEKVFKTVYFYLMEYEKGDINDHDFEVSDSKWLEKEKVRKTLTYKNDKKAFEEALRIFRKLKINTDNQTNTALVA
ncbi:MAG: MutT/nudix family protein [Candidatus Levybacteria bacterium GW2011_GWA2_40_8]|nr:MAG: MutT/nudix family protein [Candidatus Levybacteria bacterium GW2011_GWA2_40_8]